MKDIRRTLFKCFYLFVGLVLFLFIKTYRTEIQPTIDMNLKNIIYTEETYEISKNVIATVIVEKCYDIKTEKECSNIKLYVLDKEIREDIFFCFTSSYYVNWFSNDAECIKQVFYEVLDFEDEFINESIRYFKKYQKPELTKDFIKLRRELGDYDGYVLFEFGEDKKCTQIDDLTYTTGNGNNGEMIIESKVYNIVK